VGEKGEGGDSQKENSTAKENKTEKATDNRGHGHVKEKKERGPFARKDGWGESDVRNCGWDWPTMDTRGRGHKKINIVRGGRELVGAGKNCQRGGKGKGEKDKISSLEKKKKKWFWPRQTKDI